MLLPFNFKPDDLSPMHFCAYFLYLEFEIGTFFFFPPGLLKIYLSFAIISIIAFIYIFAIFYNNDDDEPKTVFLLLHPTIIIAFLTYTFYFDNEITDPFIKLGITFSQIFLYFLSINLPWINLKGLN
jgi:hypothetical protein